MFDTSTTFVDASGAVVPYTPAALSDGQRVEVSGVAASATELRASMVRVKTGNQPEYEAKGHVVVLAGSGFQLSLVPGGAPYLNVLASTIPAGVANGSIVEVKGTAFTAGTPGTLVATLVELEDRLFGDRSSEMEVEGVIAGLGGASPGETFTVAGQAVRLTAATRFVGAADPAQPRLDLADGLKVEVEGQLDGAGAELVATKLQFKDGARLQAAVQSVATGSFTLLGKTIVTDAARTRLDDVTLGAIAPGAQLEVRGYPMVDGRIFAQRIRLRDGGNDRPFLRGVVTGLAGTTATILGIPIELANASDGYRSHDDAPMSQAAFLGALQPGETFVKVRWEREATSTSDRVREAELEND